MNEFHMPIAYINMKADDLLRTCFREFGGQNGYKDALEVALRGTLPRRVLENIEQNSMVVDSKGLSYRFFAQRRVYIDSWSELLNIASLTYFYNSMQVLNSHFVASIGIESAYKESSLREKYLGDGAIASNRLGGRQIVQSCLAQNIRGKSTRESLQKEVITRLQAKLSTAPDEPERILAVTIVSETEDFDKLNFYQIAQEIAPKYKEQSTYGPVFCVIPSIRSGKPQVVVVPLLDFLPGGISTVAVIKSEFFLGTESM